MKEVHYECTCNIQLMRGLISRVLILGMATLTTACNRQPVYTHAQHVAAVRHVQPGVVFGYVGNDYMAKITDPTGVQYLMQYNTFVSLYNSGGYRGVSSYYWQNPTSPATRHWSSSMPWQPSNTADAVEYSAGYVASYQNACMQYKEQDSQKLVHKPMPRRQ